ncbi:SBBP repeat-containing protein [Candidatus Acetothermia bacterium]|nr:SBBP repeat-containing protein [Candidatus Acetothermia bacterium]
MDEEVIFALAEERSGNGPATPIHLHFAGSNQNPQIDGLAEEPGKVNFFLSDNPQRWQTQVPAYQGIAYRKLYPGIDLVYRGNEGHLKSEFVIAPGTDPDLIRMQYTGMNELKVGDDGALRLKTGMGELREEAPEIYQEINGTKFSVPGRYRIMGSNQVGFTIQPYDSGYPLIIDPVLEYATYLGGDNRDIGRSIAVDAAGNIYVLGNTFSTNFPTKNPLQGSLAGGTSVDLFVAKLNATGTTLIYSTYLGGSNIDTGHALAVDGLGNAYVAGVTFSSNFPTKNPLQASRHGSSDLFVAKLDPTGSTLVYSTYLGGSGAENYAPAIAADSGGDIYVTGTTSSTDFPTQNPVQAALGGATDSFVTEIDPAGTKILFSTFLGGSGGDSGTSIKVDDSHNVYLAGYTDSANFPGKNPLQGVAGGGTCGSAPNTYPCYDAFLTKLNTSGDGLLYSTYLGGEGDDLAYGIALDASGNIYITGDTTSNNFPTKTPLQAAFGGQGICGTDPNTYPCEDTFIAKVDATGTALIYSTYFGGTGDDQGIGIAVDNLGDAYVSGSTNSPNFPSVSSLQQTPGGGTCGTTPCYDLYVAKLNPTGSALIFSTYLGGNNNDYGQGIALTTSGDAILIGSTNSSNFPTQNPLQATFGGGTCGTAPNTIPCYDVFVARIADSASQGQQSATFQSLMLDGTDSYVSIPYSANLNPTDAITIEAWVKPTESRCETLVGNGYQQSYWLGLCSNTRFYYGNGKIIPDSTTTPKLNEWIHIAVTFQSNTQPIVNGFYINGERENQTAHLQPAADGMALYIGADRNGGGYYFKGLIDEVRIWNVILTQEQIQANMHKELNEQTPGLVAVWHFNGDAKDALGAHNGELKGHSVFSDEGFPGKD